MKRGAKGRPDPGWFDRAIAAVAPQWGLRRREARVKLSKRSYDAASGGPRTADWRRDNGDANVANGPYLVRVRETSRELKRNNGWARRALAVWGNNVIGRGLVPVAIGVDEYTAGQANEIWREWAESTLCDHDGRQLFRGKQRLAFDSMIESGECLLARRRGPGGILQVQLLESDYLDHNKNGLNADGTFGEEGGPIIHGVEFNDRGARVAYWIFDQHPGSYLPVSTYHSRRVPAKDIIHLYHQERPGQVRGFPWLAAAVLKLKDYEGWHDAEMQRKWTAAQFAVFVRDIDGTGVGDEEDDTGTIERLTPAMIEYLPQGKDISLATPPQDAGADVFAKLTLHAISVGIGPGGLPFEELTGDMSQANFTQSRMGRQTHWAGVESVREHTIIPQLCHGVWAWVMEDALIRGDLDSIPRSKWTGQPMPFVDPGKEVRAMKEAVRATFISLPEAQRRNGFDPGDLTAEVAASNQTLDENEITSDADPRNVNDQGILQIKPGAAPKNGAPPGKNGFSTGASAGQSS